VKRATSRLCAGKQQMRRDLRSNVCNNVAAFFLFCDFWRAPSFHGMEPEGKRPATLPAVKFPCSLGGTPVLSRQQTL
jgi:hypothetical protein